MTAPNLGGRTPKILAKDDAELVHMVRVDDIANGKYAMPFCHVYFLMDYYRRIGREDYAQRFEVLFDLSRLRNRDIMSKVNDIVSQHEGKTLFDLKAMNYISVVDVMSRAKEFGVSTDKYVLEDDDVAQSTTPWCLDQLTAPGKAADNVQIITDLDGIDWIVLIVRKFGPGRNNLALAGGFVDANETFTQAAIRENDEETEVVLYGSYKTSYTDLNPVHIPDWDPRARLPYGVIVAARVTHHVFER